MATLRASESRVSGRLARPREKGAVRIVATNSKYGELCRGSIRRIPSRSRSNLSLLAFEDWKDVKVPQTVEPSTTTIFVSRLADIVAEAGRKAREAGRTRHLLFSEGMPIESLASRLPQLDIRDAHRIHVAREEDPESISEILYRLMSAMAESRDVPTILDAWVEGDELVLLSPRFERFPVPLKKLEKYIGRAKRRVKEFEIDEDGGFLFWPHADVHLGWEQMMQIVDPTTALAAQKKTEEFNRRYGAAIRSLREESGLKQAAIEGLTERHLRRIEQGKQSVTSSALKALANAHGMRIEEYMKELAAKCG